MLTRDTQRRKARKQPQQEMVTLQSLLFDFSLLQGLSKHAYVSGLFFKQLGPELIHVVSHVDTAALTMRSGADPDIP